jgi:hypothetical protein
VYKQLDGSMDITDHLEPGSRVITGQVPIVLFQIIILPGVTQIHIQAKEVISDVHPIGVVIK